MSVDYEAILSQLEQPFSESLVRWRAGTVSRDKKRAMALPYVDMRSYFARLNEVCPALWSSRLVPWGDSRLICELTIGELTRSSSGEFDSGDFAPGTSAEAQAFKRACTAWGLGAYLYELPTQWVDYDDGRKQLLESPKVPERYLPKVSQVPKVATEETLNNQRASAMHREIGKLGIKNQYAFAADVLGRDLDSYTELTEAEALHVWSVAKKRADEQRATA